MLFDQITTPPKVQKLPRTLYRKAKVRAQRKWVQAPPAAAGVDGPSCSTDTRSDETRSQWRDTLLEELRTKTYRPKPVRRLKFQI